MDTSTVVDLGRQALWMTVLISAPLLGVALAVGLVIGILQAATSINEMTLSFIPKLAALALTLAVVGGWQLNGIVNIQSGSALGIGANNTAGLFTEAIRANNNGTSATLHVDAHQRLDRWFDTSVFSQPAPFTLGNMSPLISNLRNHHINNVDMSVFKQFQILEKLKLQFRAEAFNAMNRVRFGSPNTSVTGGANFGRVTSQSNDPRQMQFGLKLIW